MKINLAVILFITAIQTGCVNSSKLNESAVRAETLEVNHPPLFSVTSQNAGSVGQVILRVLVSESGDPIKVEVQQSSGFAKLDEAALSAVRNRHFTPAKLGGKPIEDWVNVPIEFRLEPTKPQESKN